MTPAGAGPPGDAHHREDPAQRRGADDVEENGIEARIFVVVSYGITSRVVLPRSAAEGAREPDGVLRLRTVWPFLSTGFASCGEGQAFVVPS